MTDNSVSVIVRSKDKIDTLPATLSALRNQSVPLEIVVVDSGSTDGSLELAREQADVVARLLPHEFTFGRALNVGAAVASGQVHVALSAHCLPPTPTWVEDCLVHYEDETVAATNGQRIGPDDEPLLAPYRQTLSDVLRNPRWGFSNHASSWRAHVWSQERFNEELVAAEDREWSWRVLSRGHGIVFDPALTVDSQHRRQAGLLPLARRVKVEGRALGQLQVRPRSTSQVVKDWWRSFPYSSPRPVWQRRLAPARMIEHFVEHVGELQGFRQPLRNASWPGAQQQ